MNQYEAQQKKEAEKFKPLNGSELIGKTVEEIIRLISSKHPWPYQKHLNPRDVSNWSGFLSAKVISVNVVTWQVNGFYIKFATRFYKGKINSQSWSEWDPGEFTGRWFITASKEEYETKG